jgi:hypothetical protein
MARSAEEESQKPNGKTGKVEVHWGLPTQVAPSLSQFAAKCPDDLRASFRAPFQQLS